uniref:Uncharacterized protein n=1 Tax=Solanum lycopersicum TaxID=4081 RepID=A0A3Q7GQA7_SOLLC
MAIQNMRVANFVVKKPMVLGHECAGIVEQVGSQVKFLMIGDRVALEPGSVNYAKTATTISVVVHPAHLCFKLPDNVQCVKPLSVGVHACHRANVGPDTKLIIIGAVPIGLLTILAAHAFGSPQIVIIDVDDCCLSFAKEMGADEIIKVSSIVQDVEEEVVRIRNAMGGPVDLSFDCVDYDTTLKATHVGGNVCLVGLGQSKMTLPLTSAAA